MAYTQHNSPFSRKGKAKKEAKRQLKSLYKQGYSDITRTTDADGNVSYAGAGERGPEQKLDRRSRRNIREEARGDKMTNKMNMDQKGNRTTDVKRIGMNRNSSSPLNQSEYDWDVTEQTTIDPNTGEVVYGPWSGDERTDLDGGVTQIQQNRDVTQTIPATTDQQATDEQLAEFKDRCIGPNGERLIGKEGCSWDDTVNTAQEVRTRRERGDLEPINLPTNDIVPVEGDSSIEVNIDDIPQVIGGPTGVEENITIGSNKRNIRQRPEKVPVVKNKEVRKPGMQKVCTNWEWVERGSGQGERRSDAGPRPTVTKSKTVMRRP